MTTEPVATSAEIYGRLKEGAHFAGYSFERACTHLEWLLEADRWKLGGRYDDVNKFLESIKLDQFRIVAEQRKRVAQRIKELQPEASQRAIAKVIGVDEGTVRGDLKPAENSARGIGNGSKTAAAPAGSAENSAPPTADMSGSHAAQLLSHRPRGTLGTGENDWHTPSDWLDRARTVLGRIDLDPASSPHAQRTVKAKQFFTVDDDGLTKEWHGNVFLNPPYAKPALKPFAKKLVAEIEAGRVTQAIALTHNFSDTYWWHLLDSHAAALCFPKGRIRFIAPDGRLATPTQGQTFFYFGRNVDLFRATFADAGRVRGR